MVKMFCINILRLFPSLIFMFGITGCSWLIPEDEEFTFDRLNYTGSSLIIDGYYFDIFESEWQGQMQTMYSIMFFFRNGITLVGDFPTNQELAAEEESYRNGQYYQNEKQNKLKWGIFKVDGDVITREIWSNPNGTYLVTIQKILILNDSTIQFTSSERIDGSGKKSLNNTYHFKPFSPKPDSVVSFIP